MERLTARNEKGGAYYPRCFEEPCLGVGDCVDLKCRQQYDVCEKLAAYEDTGLTTEQIRKIDKLYAEKCKELAEAEPYLRLAEKLSVCDLVRENKRLSDKILHLEAEAKLAETEDSHETD